MEGSRMNANRLINMAINMIVRRAMKSGIDAGAKALSNRNSGQNPDAPQQAKKASGGLDTRDLQKRARQTMRLGRRFGRF
ncbi:MAG: hypothetical protein AAFO72_10170 [Pseudomonadota bacterium]